MQKARFTERDHSIVWIYGCDASTCDRLLSIPQETLATEEDRHSSSGLVLFGSSSRKSSGEKKRDEKNNNERELIIMNGDIAQQEETESPPSQHIHNGPTSIWIPEDASNNVSTLRGEDETIDSMNTHILELSMGTGGLTNSLEDSSDLANFSRRTSDLSEEARQQPLKPAAVLESNRKSARMFPVSRLRFATLGLVGRDEERELLGASLKRVAPQEGGASRELILISGAAYTAGRS